MALFEWVIFIGIDYVAHLKYNLILNSIFCNDF